MKAHPGKFVQLALALVTLSLALAFTRPVRAASWLTNSPMNSAREWHTATLLPNGKVLVAGGYTNYGAGYLSTASAELYDLATGTWATTSSMPNSRGLHTATLLPNGKVLVAGGYRNPPSTDLSSAELYDPATETWTPTAPMNLARDGHTATLLSDGRVLVAAGTFTFTDAEVYDPSNGKWTLTNPLNMARADHTATLLPDGRVLVAGGFGTNILFTADVELFDPATGNWTTTNSMSTARFGHTATLLPNGKVLVAGGTPLTSISELFDPATGTWTTTATANDTRFGHTATILANGRVLIAGGSSNLATYLSSMEVYDSTINPATGTWTNTGAMNAAREYHTATLLPNGKVLVAGGAGSHDPFLSSAEFYDPASGTWMITSSMTAIRGGGQTATLLPNGKVLVAGGYNYFNDPQYLSSAELYDPDTGTWTVTGALNTGRYGHTATLLLNGKVLVVGGSGGGNGAELYDSVAGTWTVTGALTTARNGHTATLLPNGAVLVAGGGGTGAELYDPTTERWTTTGTLTTARWLHSATLLPNGQVLVAAGFSSGGITNSANSAETYDPATGNWTVTGALNTARLIHTATLLHNGKVLVTGGFGINGNCLSTVELYDPVSGTWAVTGTLNTARWYHSATLLPCGKVLVVGGEGGDFLTSAELFDVGLGYSNTWQPQIASITSPLSLGGSMTVNGSGFRGVSGGSSGNNHDSPGDYPLVQLRSLESGQTKFLLTTNWSTNSFMSLPVWNFPPGYALATVFVNGIPSTSSIVNISVPIPVATTLTDAKKPANGSFQFAFTNSVGALFGVLVTTNLSLPLSNWTALGGIMEISPGQFEFTDPQATSNAQRFYRVRSP